MTNEAFWEIRPQLRSDRLALVEHKMEVVLMTKCRKQTSIKFRVDKHTINSQTALKKYLGVMIGQKVNFKPHLESLAIMASGVAMLLAKILPNVGGFRIRR